MFALDELSVPTVRGDTPVYDDMASDVVVTVVFVAVVLASVAGGGVVVVVVGVILVDREIPDGANPSTSTTMPRTKTDAKTKESSFFIIFAVVLLLSVLG